MTKKGVCFKEQMLDDFLCMGKYTAIQQQLYGSPLPQKNENETT
jgi:hypothetical protein